MKTNLPIECRAKPSLWWSVLGGSLLSIFLLVCPFFVYLSDSKPGQSIWWLFVSSWGMALFMAFCALWTALDLKKGVIRADETGLTWQHPFSGQKSAKWEISTAAYPIREWLRHLLASWICFPLMKGLTKSPLWLSKRHHISKIWAGN